jgi:hypothetical protein
MRTTFARALSVSFVLLLVTPSAGNAASSSGKQQHCIVEALAVGSASTSSVRCYATFAAAIKAATSGRVNLQDATTSKRVSSVELTAGPDSATSTYVLSVDYHDSNFSGSTFTWYASLPCGYYQTGSMPSGWNDVVSSVAAYSGCATTLYQNSNFGGAVYRIGVNGAAASLGSFNDQTSSQKWCPVYPCS